MSVVEITSPVMTESAGQAIATAISTMSSTSVGNLSALTTTDKSSLVGAINELKSGLTNLTSIVEKANQVLDLTNVTVPRTNVKKYTFTGVNLDNKVVAINTTIPTYGILDSRILYKQTGHDCKYYAAVTDENNYTWAANIVVGGDYVAVETLSSSQSPSDYPISLDYVVIVNRF